ncbi:non-ribosomal peptide synthetase [Streptomyces sp. S.PB5]|uniref:non-ribosomal peptide synthetase n=1 Tax=Streptomyces sp. S.PB5 TaxID=3020844 RepID=UPI0025B0DA27|nr:non-ribosomal peptide synthetase [Streptomyces sp. S.PB5]MDN3027889.1 non-ribosomal peptide synthetase [Streptomyces sp. S.PB5]
MQGTFQRSTTLHGLFEERVREVPGGIALELDGVRVTYGELDRRADGIAHHLRTEFDVRPDDRVAVVVRDPIGAVTAMLAILKAGGAYVPLDPDHPPAAVQAALDVSGAVAAVIDSSCASGLAFFGGGVFIVDVMGDGLEAPADGLEPAAGPSDLAYVMHTSGSTGRPKAVAVEHRAIVDTVIWRNRYYGFGPGRATLAIPRPFFDSSVADIFCALTSGSRLVLVSNERVTDRPHLLELIENRGISHFLITPALYRRLLDGVTGEAPASLQSVTVAGEGFGTELVAQHYDRFPHVQLYNEYGPSENAVCSTVHPLRASDTEVLIGSAIDNTYTLVMDEHGAPVGPGGTGELLLGGPRLARGYLGDPELTAEKFVEGVPAAGERRRFYRSGDFVRVHDNGALQFVGRRDRQVKIRGRRVELEHVAQRLTDDPAVDEAFVILAPGEPPRLLAFVVGPAAGDAERVRTAARDRLPAHMVPAAVLPVGELPLTRNGKVDQRALLALYEETLPRSGPSSTGLSSTEAPLLALWRELLPHAAITPEASLFELGGDSLTLMSLLEAAEKETGVRIDLTDVYGGFSLRRMAELIEQQQGSVA